MISSLIRTSEVYVILKSWEFSYDLLSILISVAISHKFQRSVVISHGFHNSIVISHSCSCTASESPHSTLEQVEKKARNISGHHHPVAIVLWQWGLLLAGSPWHGCSPALETNGSWFEVQYKYSKYVINLGCLSVQSSCRMVYDWHLVLSLCGPQTCTTDVYPRPFVPGCTWAK